MSNNRSVDYWYIHGKAYDLRNFAAVHPGGLQQLMSVQGRECTELVHSMHSMADMTKVDNVLSKYEVKEVGVQDDNLFTWKKDGMYETLRARVKEYIKTKGKNETHKASTTFWFITALEIAV